MTSVDELPLFNAMAAPEWSSDLPGVCAELFHHRETPLLLSLDGSVVVYGNEDLRRLAADPRIGNLPAPLLARAFQIGAGGSAFERLVANHVFTMNPPEHGPLRRLFARQFTARNVGRFAAQASSIVDSVIGEAVAAGESDLVRDLANRVAVEFWGELIGLTPAARRRLAAMLEEVTSAFSFARTPEQTEAVDRVAGDYLALVGDAIRLSLAAGDNELLTAMADEFAAVELDGRPKDLGQLLGAVLMDGFHTLAVGIANVAHTLLRDEAAWHRVRADHTLAPAAVHEALRLAPPSIFTQRFALDDVEHDGVVIPAGTALTMLWFAGNRDPERFPDPDRLDLDRPRAGATTFGGGIHLCPGRTIAGLLIEVVVQALTRADVRFTGAAEWVPASSMRQLTTMPAVLTGQLEQR